jgi:hypothetical protein
MAHKIPDSARTIPLGEIPAVSAARVFVGIDLASSEDRSAFTVITPDGRHLFLDLEEAERLGLVQLARDRK